MALVQEDERVIPSQGNYKGSVFSIVVSVIILVIFLAIIFVILFGIMNLIAGVVLFRQATELGLFDKVELLDGDGVGTGEFVAKGFDPTPENIQRYNYANNLRLGFALLIMGYVMTFPIKWLLKTYGYQSVSISEEGVEIYKFPFNRTYAPWDGILDITVKQSDSVFSNIVSNAQKIVVYTMDKSVSIEDITIANSHELGEKLRVFGDSLDERVIDFGYGESLAVIWRRMKRNKIGVFGASLVVFFLAYATLGAVIGIIFPLNSLISLQTEKIFIFWNPQFTNFEQINTAPNSTYIFGTDSNGRDIFSRLLFGAFYSILIAVISTIISTVIGAVVGAASGYMGGTIDNVVQRLTEILNAMPGLPILLLISTSITLVLSNIDIEGAYYLAVYSIFALIGWGGIARIVRSEVLGLKYSEFIQAEIVLGSTHGRIIRKHIIPNAFSTVIIFFTLGVAGNIIGVASLSYLGFGSNSTLVWGKDLSDAITNEPLVNWWGVTFISLMLFLLVLGFNLLGDTLRDALDPTLKE